MKVLNVIPSLSLRDGGPTRALATIERALSHRGVDVTTIATVSSISELDDVSAYGTPVSNQHATRIYFKRETQLYKVSLGLMRWVRQNIKRYDVVHAHALFSFAPIAAAFAANGSAVPYVLRPLGVLGKYGMTRRRPVLKKISLSLVERKLLKAAGAVHFTSFAEQEAASGLGFSMNGVVIPLAVEIPDRVFPIHRGEGAEAFNLLFLSRIDPKKNIETLLEALALITDLSSPVRLTIAGDGESNYVDGLKAAALRLGVAERVRWIGHVEGEAKALAHANAHAFVLPSHEENFGIAVAEALAVGLPVIISSAVAIAKEVKTSSAGVVTGSDAFSIASGIQQLSNHPDRRAAMARAARTLAESEFSLPVLGIRLESLYRQLLLGRPSNRPIT